MTATFKFTGLVLDNAKQPVKRASLSLSANPGVTQDGTADENYVAAPKITTNDEGFICLRVGTSGGKPVPADTAGVDLVKGCQYAIHGPGIPRTPFDPPAGSTLDLADLPLNVGSPPPSALATILAGLSDTDAALDVRVTDLEDNPGGGGSGTVTSVNGDTGPAVVLDAADVGARPSTYVPTWSEVTSKPTTFTPSAHGHTSTDITDFTEAAQDAVAAMLASGANVTLSYNDAGNSLQVTASGTDAEVVRDTIGAALAGINGVTVAVNDGADTITLSITGLSIAQTTGLQAALDALVVADATDTTKGKVELATTAETQTGTDTVRAVTPAGVKAVADLKEPLRPLAVDTVALLGDSITANNYTTIFGVATNDIGYWNWAAIYLRQRLKLAGVFGYAGQQISVIATHVSDALAVNPGRVVVEAGTNDVLQSGRTLATMKTDMTALLAPLLAARVQIIIGTVIPESTWTAGQKTLAGGFNRWLLDYGQSIGATVVDWTTPLADPSTGLPITNATSDGRHPASLGAAKMGQALALALESSVPAIDVLATAADPTVLNLNSGFYSGSPIATNYTLYDKTVATSGARAGCVPTKVARTDSIPGFMQQAVVTDGNGAIFRTDAISSGWAVGDTIYALWEYERDDDWAMGTDDNSFRAQVFAFSSFQPSMAMSHAAGDPYPTSYLPLSGVLRTPNMAIPSGTTALYGEFGFAGSGTIRAMRFQIRKV